MTESTIGTDVQDNSADTEFNAVDAFSKLFSTPKDEKPKAIETKNEREEEAEEELETSAESDDATDSDENSEEVESEEGNEPESEEPHADPEDKTVSVKVGDETHEVSIKELTRLWGQEASLTRKSQETSAALKRATEEGEKAVAIYSELIRRSERAWKEKGFDKVDLAQAAVLLQHNPQAYTQLRQDYIEAQQHHAFLVNEANNFVNQVKANRAAMQQEALKRTDEVLASDPEVEKTIGKWNAEKRKEVADYAIKQGVPSEVANNLAEKWAIQVLIKAMKFDKGVQASKKDSVKTPSTTPATSPKKVLKPGAKAPTSATPKLDEAMSKLRKTGKMDDAAAAFSARFGGTGRGKNTFN